jgi:hypothetical protein
MREYVIKKIQMKRLIFIAVVIMLGYMVAAQPTFNLGIKGGLTISDFSLDKANFSSENILGYHAGAFARAGWGRLFLQPEAYFSSRGGKIFEENNPLVNLATKFDFSTVDVPVLLGFKLIKGEFINVRAMGGPIFSFLTSKEVDGPGFGASYFRDNFYGWQYGVGIDLWFVTLDARLENSSNSVIQTSDFSARNKTFVLSAGIKLF